MTEREQGIEAVIALEKACGKTTDAESVIREGEPGYNYGLPPGFTVKRTTQEVIMKATLLVLALLLPLQGCVMVASNTGWPGALAGEILGYSYFEMSAAGILTDEVAGSIATGIKAREPGPQITLKTSNRKARAFCDKQFNDTDARKRCYGRTR